MELAVLLAAGLRDWIDLGVIIGILMLNAIVGWYQEKQAADVVASLKGDIAMRAWVIRDGSEQEILGKSTSLDSHDSHATNTNWFSPRARRR
jgi:H+-transporting ATPase